MSLLELIAATISCLVIHTSPSCTPLSSPPIAAAIAGTQRTAPIFSGESVDVVLTAQAALVWDVKSGAVLYEKNAGATRPIASLAKLLTVLVARDMLSPDVTVTIPTDALRMQRMGAHIRLPIGERTTVHDLLAASLIPSANDAAVSLAVAAAGSEEAFVSTANQFAQQHGLPNTVAANATGLSGGVQHSTAHDVRRMLMMVYQDPELAPLLSQKAGVLRTAEGSRRAYTSTNKLLGTYVPVIAAKTGYTSEAGENLAIITEGDRGQWIGAVILGSEERFQDMKILVEWIWRNYTWP